MKTLALFDFDGTITRGDSLLEFLWHMVGVKNALWGTPEVLARWLFLAGKFNLSHDTAKEELLRVHMLRRSREEWDVAVKDFMALPKKNYFNEPVLEALRYWRDQGAQVAVVSASIDIWLAPFAEKEQVDLICTRSAWTDGRWTGFSGPNCRGAEKVHRIKSAFPLEDYQHIVAYGNSGSDIPMLSMAHEAWMVGRKGRLKAWQK
ncbi:MAG: HAD-IB family hydrolase [Lewinellaceae bacterium]|nr:HAD-IB family hydrolase [Lewinellaceae bacterium]